MPVEMSLVDVVRLAPYREEVAEFEYRPVACERAYRVVVLRKRLAVEKGQLWLFAAIPHAACLSDLSDAAYRVLGAVLYFARRGSCDD